MKVMLVFESWGTGGTEQYVRSLYSSLKRIDSEVIIHLVLIHDVSVPSCLACERWIDECTALGRSSFDPCLGLRRLVLEEKPDVCHLHLYSSTLAAVIAIKTAGARSKIFATFHSPISQWSWRHRFGFRVAVSMCDTVIGASAFTAGELHKWREDVVAAAPPVEVGGAHLATDSRGQKADRSVPFRVVGCGRLSREKDWSTLIRAIARCDREAAISGHLIGSGSMREQLTDEIRQQGCENRFHLEGALSHEETLRRVAAADLFVLPSRFEGFGIAAVEAMALGVPTITSDFPASQEYIVPGETGHRFPIGDSESLAGLIDWHFRNRDQSRQMGRAGQAAIGEAFSAERSAQLYLQLYRQ